MKLWHVFLVAVAVVSTCLGIFATGVFVGRVYEAVRIAKMLNELCS